MPPTDSTALKASAIMSNWTRTSVAGLHVTGEHVVWGPIVLTIQRNGGMGGYEWADLATGSMVALVPSGTWEEGGEYVLFWLNPIVGKPLDITDALSSLLRDMGEQNGHRLSRYYRPPADGGSSREWSEAGKTLAKVVDALLDVDNAEIETTKQILI